MIEGSLEIKLPTTWTNQKQRSEESGKRKAKEEDQRRERVRRKKMQVHERVFSHVLWLRRVEKIEK